MRNQKIIGLEEARPRWQKGGQVTSGIYGLAAPGDPRIRYIGSSDCIEARLHEHFVDEERAPTHGSKLRFWIVELKIAKLPIEARVIEEVDFSRYTRRTRLDLERDWIAAYRELAGECDLNRAMTKGLTKVVPDLRLVRLGGTL